MNREDFDSSRPVQLKILTRGEDGTLLYPGEYELDDIPDAAIACGAIRQSSSSSEQPVLEPEPIATPITNTTVVAPKQTTE